MNKKVVGFVLIIALALAAGIIFKASQKTTLSFVNNDTNTPIEGKIFLDNKYLDDTTEGKIEVSKLGEDYPKIISLVGQKNGEPFELQYKLDKNYSDYSVYYFETKSDEIEMGKRYYAATQNDKFSDTNEYHWPKMPLTYKYEENCNVKEDKNFANKVKSALDYISRETNEAVAFSFTDKEYADITFNCEFNEPFVIALVGPKGEKAHASPSIYPNTKIYADGIINLYEKDSCALGQKQVVIAHEVLHLLGLKHNTNSSADDIMAPAFSGNGCNKKITQKDIDYLIEIYAESLSNLQ